MLKENRVEPGDYREAMSRFAGAVHVVTTDGVAGRRGTTVIAACSVSDDPPTVLVCLNRGNPANDLFAANGVFALNTLYAGQIDISNAFSGLTGLSQDQRFAMGQWDTIESGAPTLLGSLATFDCRIVDTKDIATHRVLYGKVTGLRLGDTLQPLIYHARAYHALT